MPFTKYKKAPTNDTSVMTIIPLFLLFSPIFTDVYYQCKINHKVDFRRNFTLNFYLLPNILTLRV